MAQPKYMGLTNELRKEVLSGRYGPEGGLPSVRDLAQRFNAAVNTVQSAMHILESEGLIIKRGQNFYVNGIAITMTQHVPLPTARYRPQGYAKTLYVGVGPVPDYVSRKLGLESSVSEVLIRDQVAGEMNGKERPLQLTHRYYFLALSDAQVERLKSDPEWDPMWDITTVLLARNEDGARPATMQEAKHLELPDGTSVLAIWEVIRDLDGTLLMAQDVTLAPRETLVYEFPFENKPKS